MFRKLCDRGGTPAVSLVKDHLRRDGILEDGEIPDRQEMWVERVDEGVYVVRAVDPDDEIAQAEVAS
jgi:hypothetical protein